MNTDHSDHAPLHKIGNFTDGFIPNEVRSKSSTPDTEIQKLVKEAGFWQDQSVRERENVIKLAMENEKLTAQLSEAKRVEGRLVEALEEIAGPTLELRTDDKVYQRLAKEALVKRGEAT